MTSSWRRVTVKYNKLRRTSQEHETWDLVTKIKLSDMGTSDLQHGKPYVSNIITWIYQITFTKVCTFALKKAEVKIIRTFSANVWLWGVCYLFVTHFSNLSNHLEHVRHNVLKCLNSLYIFDCFLYFNWTLNFCYFYTDRQIQSNKIKALKVCLREQIQ